MAAGVIVKDGKVLVDGDKLRGCCCGCPRIDFSVVFSYYGGNISATSGDHTILGDISADATGCGSLSFSSTAETFAAVSATSAGPYGCDGACGRSTIEKRASRIDGTFRAAVATTPATNAATVGYECNRFFSWTSRPSVNFRVASLVVAGLPAGRTLNVRYRRTGYDPGTTPWIAVTQDGAYADPAGSSVFEGGTTGTNTNLYVDFYFT